MLRTLLLLFLVFPFLSNGQSNTSQGIPSEEQIIVSTDISNFWKAFDGIDNLEDSVQQLDYLNSVFIDKASKGQKRMMEARGYTPEEYLKSILTKKQFWNSIRKNTEDLEPFNKAIMNGMAQLKEVYPSLKPSTIYYTMGNHRSPGTGVDDMVLLGTEFALGDLTTVTSELPEHLQNYYKINPVDHLSFSCVHEYVHTQQQPMVHNLLSLTLYEGIAEFVAIKATGQSSPWKAFITGPENEERIKLRIEADMFNPNSIYNWLWNSPKNEFETSDLGYFVGYQIANRYYDASADKKAAIKTLIELDYEDEPAVEAMVNSTLYFSDSLEELYNRYESKRPKVVSITEFKTGSESVDPNLKVITLNFSMPMDTETRGFEFGPLGEENVLMVKNVIGFSEDKKSFSFEVELKENRRYQSYASRRFQSESGYPLKPFLIDFTTGENKIEI
jgi:hypothetical protein